MKLVYKGLVNGDPVYEEVEDSVTTKMVNGIHLFLTEKDQQEVDERDAAAAGRELPDAKAAATLSIDEHAELERLKYITPGSAQAMAYLKQEQEATAFVDDPSPAPEKYPHIYAKVGTSDGATAADVAQTFRQNAAAWAAVSAHIEGLRKRAKDAVAAAETVQAAWEAASVDYSIEGA